MFTGYNTACLECDKRFITSALPFGEVHTALCRECNENLRVKKSRKEEVIDFRKYLVKRHQRSESANISNQAQTGK